MTDGMRRLAASPVVVTVGSLLLCGVIGAVLILVAGHNPIEAYRVLFGTAFGLANNNLFTTLSIATPLILTGLSAMVAFRAGLFSLGQEGQYLLGAIASVWVGYTLQVPALLHIPLALGAGVLAGAAYGFIPGWLRVRANVNELLVTIVLNAIAIIFVRYLINGPMRADRSTTAYTQRIEQTARLPAFVTEAKFGLGFVIAVAACVAVYVYVFRSTHGFEQRIAGRSPNYARFAGLPADRAQIRAMILSGGLAGLGGAIQVTGSSFRVIEGFSAGTGFDGLTTAVLGGVHPLGVLIVAIVLAGVRLGAQSGLQVELGIPREIGGVLIAVAILIVAIARVRGSATPSANVTGNILDTSSDDLVSADR